MCGDMLGSHPPSHCRCQLIRCDCNANDTDQTRLTLGKVLEWLMLRRRAATAGIMARIGNRTFQATGITA
jgi:hypothetical protein